MNEDYTLQQATEDIIAFFQEGNDPIFQENGISKILAKYGSNVAGRYFSELPIPTNEEILKEGCTQHNIEYHGEEDIYDAVRLNIWCDGAKWMRKKITDEIFKEDHIKEQSK